MPNSSTPILSELSRSEVAILKKLSTPIKIQNFLDAMPLNWEKQGETYMSPRRVMRAHKMHCFEGALLAAAALWLRGEPPLIFDLRVKGDDDHVVALYKRHGHWGAISKTNHASLRFRDPIYKTLRELALSYFHEYFSNQTSKKILREYSTKPFNLKRFGTQWITAEEDLYKIVDAIDAAPHSTIIPKSNIKYLRKADVMELRAGKLIEWKRADHRT
ncbi:MAG: hypothetical protein ACD_43C00120G0001 [uncultured bacterium]|nr:MAG: hypothetical protein ACD_43C00120G0001 [uncultured bacterium]